MNPFAILGFAGSLLSASATIARGKEIKRQKEMEAAQLEQDAAASIQAGRAKFTRIGRDLFRKLMVIITLTYFAKYSAHLTCTFQKSKMFGLLPFATNNPLGV